MAPGITQEIALCDPHQGKLRRIIISIHHNPMAQFRKTLPQKNSAASVLSAGVRPPSHLILSGQSVSQCNRPRLPEIPESDLRIPHGRSGKE